jgi:hypothetical protein
MAAKVKDKVVEDEKGRKPDWVVRARQEVGSDYWMTVGVGWDVEVKGKKAISLKLHSYPVSGDGGFLILPPFEE